MSTLAQLEPQLNELKAKLEQAKRDYFDFLIREGYTFIRYYGEDHIYAVHPDFLDQWKREGKNRLENYPNLAVIVITE